MNEDTFWNLIERANTDTPLGPHPWSRLNLAVDLLVDRLVALGPEAILGFDAILTEKLGLSYTWELWGAAHVINGGCSDDGFDYFRGWLIGQGRAAFEAALADPESLAGIADEACECEEMLYAAYRAYVEAAGQEPPAARLTRMVYELGEPWHVSELPARYPRLWAAFGEAEAA